MARAIDGDELLGIERLLDTANSKRKENKMKRLTGRKDGRAYIVGCPDFALPKIAGLIIQQTVDRLAAIEDILGDEYDLDELKEVVQAKREGKIPKYTIGDTVYDRFGNAWEVTAVELHSMRTKNEWLYRCGHKGTDDYRALWHFEAFPSKEAALRREQE